MSRILLAVGMRAKLALATMAIVGLALVMGTGIVSLALYSALTSSLKTQATAQLQAIVDLVGREGLEGLNGETGAEVGAGAVVQLIDAQGRLLYSSRPGAPLTTLHPAIGQVLVEGITPLPTLRDIPGPVTAATGVLIDDHPVTAAVALPQVSQREAVTTVVKLLLLGTPVIVLASGIIAWWLISRSLRPVEGIRSTVESISSRHLDARVPVSGTDDEIGRLALTMNAMLERLERGRRQQNQFVADASHELRSPLASLHTALDMGTGDPTGERWSSLAPVMVTETHRMERLVDDLLTLARGDAGSVPATRWRDVDLDDLVVEEARRPRPSGRVEVSFDVRPARVRGDRLQLVRVVRNLADNAVRAATSRVVLSVAAEGAEAVVRVEDDGPGIPEDQRERVFERFVRLDEARNRDDGGSGLGLAIVRELVALYGGSVAVDRSGLGGARFTLRLPLHRQASPEEDTSDQTVPAPDLPGPAVLDQGTGGLSTSR
ncbi:Signal transduction histidine kinase [Raineyella antarctica]|uniref:histidine kinase n=1 Tax=Raineyella antarctica TaxID=1577474 RepID=A0A1G6GCV0_9ACTN|nr:HAMP domain-containing sensor histidine kinase [Raineyella antarctica]SDB79749.1 Signal transduction histidine kinase [Raineyella antarctica]